MHRIATIGLGCVLVALGGCLAPEPNDAQAREEVRRALEGYLIAARRVDPDAIATFHTIDATLFEPGITPIVSRDAIRAFIASFPGARVDSAVATADTIEVYRGTAYVWGTYFERLAFPGQPVSEQHGRFVIEWLRQPAGQWLIHRHFRVPIPTPPAGPGPAR